MLTLWDSSLVEEALSFVEAHKVNATPCDEEDVTSVQSMSSLSPFKRITQQLRFADLRSPDADDPVTPESPTSGSNNNFHPFWTIPTQRTRHSKSQQDQFVIFPDAEEDDVGLKVINYDYKTKEDVRYKKADFFFEVIKKFKIDLLYFRPERAINVKANLKKKTMRKLTW